MGEMKDKIQALESTVKISASDIGRLEQESRSERDNFRLKIKSVEDVTNKALKQLNSQISNLHKELENSKEEHEKM